MDRVLKRLCELVAEGRAEVSERDAHAVKRSLIDSLGCALGAYNYRVPGVIREFSGRRAQADGSPVFGSDALVAPDAAAFANSVMIRLLDYNDNHASSGGIGHPSDYIPAALVALTGGRPSGRQVVRAILVGYEVFCRLTDATALGVEQIDHVLNGAVAAAAMACVANELPAEATQHALSLAVTANLSLQATRLGTLSDWKGCAAGNACRNGVVAAELAAAGLSGPTAPFEGRGGLAQVTGREVDLSAIDASDRSAISGCHIKHYPSGYFSQGAIEAALNVRERFEGRTPAAIEVRTFEFGKRVMAGDEQKWRPANRETADHSIPYVVACALARGRVTRFDLDDAGTDPQDIRGYLDRLSVEIDPDCVAAWPQACLNKVIVRFGDGSSAGSEVDFYRGHARNPMSDTELERKFSEQAEPVLGAEQAQRLLDAVWSLDEAESVDALFDWTAMEASGMLA